MRKKKKFKMIYFLDALRIFLNKKLKNIRNLLKNESFVVVFNQLLK